MSGLVLDADDGSEESVGMVDTVTPAASIHHTQRAGRRDCDVRVIPVEKKNGNLHVRSRSCGVTYFVKWRF
jgi:hypothetical protein